MEHSLAKTTRKQALEIAQALGLTRWEFPDIARVMFLGRFGDHATIITFAFQTGRRSTRHILRNLKE